MFSEVRSADLAKPVSSASVPSKALFLDRDGTLIEHIPYLHRPEGVQVLPGVVEALRQARAAGFSLYLFTNQSGVGRGMFRLEDVHAVNRRMTEAFGLGPAIFDGICIAPEAPNEPSLYRKPSPRFIQETCAAAGHDLPASWMIGDAPSDWAAGLNAGIRAAAVGVDSTEPAEVRDQRVAWGVPGFAGLLDAVTYIVHGAERPQGR